MKEKRFLKDFTVKGATIVAKNFKGQRSEKNRSGQRQFLLILDDLDFAMKLKEDGWLVKQFNRREDDDPSVEPGWYLPIAVRYEFAPPTIIVHTRENRAGVELSEEAVGELDSSDIAYIELTVHPYVWQKDDGTSGVKAYLKSMDVVIEKRQFEYDWGDDREPLPFD